MKIDHQKLVRTLRYTFRDESYIVQALTHRSAGSGHNERLEFLGDSILNFVIAQALFEKFPEAAEGVLSRLRASLVRESTLAEISRELNVGDFLRLGSGELKSGGYRRGSILADAVEAILGAVLLDGGFEACKDLILRLYEDRISLVDPDDNLKDPKSCLQEFLQARKKPLPEYRVLSVEGDPHEQVFQIECIIEGFEEGAVGVGRSRRKAEQTAAKIALEKLQVAK